MKLLSYATDPQIILSRLIHFTEEFVYLLGSFFLSLFLELHFTPQFMLLTLDNYSSHVPMSVWILRLVFRRTDYFLLDFLLVSLKSSFRDDVWEGNCVISWSQTKHGLFNEEKFDIRIFERPKRKQVKKSTMYDSVILFWWQYKYIGIDSFQLFFWLRLLLLLFGLFVVRFSFSFFIKYSEKTIER